MSERVARSTRGSLAGSAVLAAWMLLPTAHAADTAQPARPEGMSRFVAGLEPDRRPQLVPIPAEFARDGAWRARALKGVSEPIPTSLRFIEDQGAWYNPFLSPGMPGPYDIRGRHSTTGQK